MVNNVDWRIYEVRKGEEEYCEAIGCKKLFFNQKIIQINKNLKNLFILIIFLL